MNASEIIDALGGIRVVAQATGAKRNAVTQWRRIGVPAKYWPTIVQFADAAGKSSITYAVLQASRPASVTSAKRGADAEAA